jgi:hypothetical protein
MTKPVLIGFLPPPGGLPKTEEFYDYHRALINTGDIAYTLATALLGAGRNHLGWNFSAGAEVVNESFSRVIWSIPCRIAEPPYHQDGFPYERATRFIEQLDIPFTSVTESIQSGAYDYAPDFHKRLAPEVVRYLKTVADRSRVVGARGEFSADVLAKLGIRNVEPVGCPSLYLNGPALNPSLLQKKPFEEVRNVAVAYSNYQLSPTSLIAKVLAWAANRDFYFVEQSSTIIPKLLYYPHRIEAADFLKAHRWYGGLDNLRRLYNRNRIRYFTNYQNWKSFLGRMDFVFGARMHGLTPAVHSGVPAYFVAHDSRVREMCEFFKLPFASEQSLAGTPLRIEDLYDRADYRETAAAYPGRYRHFIDFLQRNEITPNCDAGLHIAEAIDWNPAPGVEVEGNPATDHPVNLRFAKVIFDLGQSIVEQGGVHGYERLVQSCCQLWHEELQAEQPRRAVSHALFNSMPPSPSPSPAEPVQSNSPVAA